MAAVEIEHETIDTGAVRLHCAHAGDGPLILFIHGFPEFWYAWRGMLEAFGRDHLAVAYDQRGYNLSDKPEGVANYSPKHLVADAAAVIRHFGREHAVVVGHDWGGSVAWALALARPEMVEKLVICNSPHPGVFARLLRDDPEQQRASGYMMKYRHPEAEAYLMADDFAQMRKGTLAPGVAAGYFDDADVEAYLSAWRRDGALTGMLNFYRAMKLFPPHKDGTPASSVELDAAAVTVTVPTLVLWGMKDPYLLPQNLDALPEYVPDLRIHRLPEGTHWIVHEFPDEVEGAIRRFGA